MFRRIIKYMLSSGISVVLDLGIFKAATYFGASIGLATAIARAISSAVNFLLNRNAVFKAEGSILVQYLKYITLVVVCATVSAWSVEQLHKVIHIDPTVIKACVDTVLFVINYIIQKLFIFRTAKQQPEQPQQS